MTNLPNPTPAPSAVTGVDSTAAFWNANVRDAINFICNPPLLVVQDPVNNTTTLTSAGTNYKIKLGTLQQDSYNGWSASNNWYSCQLAGWYQISGGVAILNTTNALYYLAGVQYNGSVLPNSNAEVPSVPTGDLQQVPIRTIHQFLNVGDTVNLYASCGAAGNKTNATSSLELRWVHS